MLSISRFLCGLTAHPNPPPRRADARGARRGREPALLAKAGASLERSDGLDPIVPSPLVGEGQGGGYGLVGIRSVKPDA